MVNTTASQATEGFDGKYSAALPELLDQSLEVGILVITADLKISTLTEVARTVLNLGNGAITFNELPNSLQQALREEAGSRESTVALEIPGPDATTRNIKAIVTPVQDRNGKPNGIVAVVQDTDSILQLEKNLRQLDRLASIGTLSASMAHEVKNALVAIQTFIDLLITQNQNAELADLVGRELKRINSIVSQMLRFGGPARPKLTTLHIHQVLQQSVTLVQHHLEGRRIQLELDLQAAPDTIRGDAYQLEQALLNLLFNALDAMGANGTLRVSTVVTGLKRSSTPAAPEIEIAIRDDGIGITPENLKRLFDTFFTTKPNGTGLGLPITRRIVEEHRGTIAVASEPHRGTLFTIRLPLLIEQQP